MRLSVAMTPTRASMPAVVVAAAPVRAPRSLPVIPCDPTPPSGIIAPPVQVAQLHTPLDRFRCAVLKATITARSCVDRQAVARGERDCGAMSFSAGGGARPNASFYMCRDCAIGAEVVGRITS